MPEVMLREESHLPKEAKLDGIPKITITFKEVKKEVDEDKGDRPACPDEVIRQIIKSVNPKEKIEKVRWALDEIQSSVIFEDSRAKSQNFFFSTLRNAKVARAFVENPEAVTELFFDISSICGEASRSVALAISRKFPEQFASDPKAFVEKLCTVNEKFGIRYFGRFKPEILDYLYDMARSPNHRAGKPLAVVILPCDDINEKGSHSDAFDNIPLEDLLKAYRLVVCEVGDETEALERIKEFSGTYGKSSLLFLGGHGDRDSMRFQSSNKAGILSILDFEAYGGHRGLEKYLTRDAKVILNACNTGSGRQGSERQNLMSMMGKLTNREVLAPPGSPSYFQFVLDRKGFVEDVVWGLPQGGARYKP